MVTADRDALAAAMFPREWAAVATVRGKTDQRRRLRYQAAKMARLHDAGERCTSCHRHLLMGAQSVCRSMSLIGDTLTTPDGLCKAWCPRLP